MTPTKERKDRMGEENVIKLLTKRATKLGSWAKLAADIGISRAYMSDLKLGNRLPSKRILDYLKLKRKIVK